MLPLPDNPTIRAQVLKPDGSSFGGESLCEIEHLFYGDPATEGFFGTEPVPGGGQRIIIKSDAQKERFATEILPSLDNSYFQVFKPLFELMKSKF